MQRYYLILNFELKINIFEKIFLLNVINQILKNAESVCINKDSKLIFFSDLHKGDNSSADDFTHNVKIYKHALQHYFTEYYTYFELGDGVELWEKQTLRTNLQYHL